MLRLTSIYLKLIIVILTVSSCVPTINVDLLKRVASSVNNGDEDEIDPLLIATLTGPLLATDSGFCFYQSSIQNYCWGKDYSLATNTANMNLVPSSLSGKTIKSLTVSSNLSCVIASDDQVYCWGSMALGNGGALTNASKVPVPVDTSGVLNGKIIKSIYLSGAGNACALDSLGELYCWGGNSTGMLGNGLTTTSNIPVALDKTGVLNGKTIKSVTMGQAHICVIASDDKVYCWGLGTFGRLGNGLTASSSVAVAAPIPGGLNVKNLVTSNNGSCAVTFTDQVYCWGYGVSGTIGNGSISSQSSPTAVNTALLAGKTISAISLKEDTACVIADGEAFCWGSNTQGRIGRGDTILSNTPVAVSTSGVLNGVSLKSIEVAERITCAISTVDRMYCWGANASGELGNGNNVSTYLPTEILMSGVLSGKTIKKYLITTYNTCVIANDDEAYCWGGNNAGQVGSGADVSVNAPAAVLKKYDLAGKKITSLAGSSFRMCLMADDNWVYCAGISGFSAGNAHDFPFLYPMAIYKHSIANTPILNPVFHSNGPDDRVLIQSNNGNVYGGFLGSVGFLYSTGSARIKKIYHSLYSSYCYLDSLNDAYCVGYYPGDGQYMADNMPRPIDMTGALSGLTIKSIAKGLLHSCALASDKNVYCWGNNTYGQLGDGTAVESRVPVAIDKTGVLSGKLIKAVYASYLSTCVIADDYQAYCWGVLTGDGTSTIRMSPVAVDNTGVLLNKKIRNITMGMSTTCAIADDLAGYCWGSIPGNGSATASSPVAITTSGALLNKTIKGFSISEAGHACLLASDDQVYCWGNGILGQLGNGGTASPSVPTALDTSGVLLNKTIKGLSTKQLSTCVLASDDKVYCFGKNDKYQLGLGHTTNSLIPAEVLYAP